MLEFNDGVKIDTEGELRIERRSDGLYVIGKGMCIPVSDIQEANRVLEDIINR